MELSSVVSLLLARWPVLVMSVEEQLWDVFTYYTLMSNPMAPANLTSQQFLKLAKEIQLVATVKGAAEAQVAISAQISAGEMVQRVGRRGVALSFGDFVQLLSRLATKCYPLTDPASVSYTHLTLPTKRIV